MRGLIHLYTGEGKGKTTAAMGLALRMAGSGKKVVIAQFLKDGSSSELNILKNLPNVFVVCEAHLGFYGKLSEDEKEKERKCCREVFSKAGNLLKDADAVIFDEIAAALKFGIIKEEELVHFLNNKPEKLEVVMTGRDMPQSVQSLCDYITEMKKIKHPFDEGITAREGIEY